MDASKPVCKYGASCYRKNPDHFKQYSHPGRREEEEEVGDRSRGEEGERKSRPSKASKASGLFIVSFFQVLRGICCLVNQTTISAYLSAY